MIRLIADMHTHTVASTHAFSTVLENCTAASQIGLNAIAVTDHSPGMPDSPHLWHFINMKVLPRMIGGVYLLRGVEADITGVGGELDMGDDVLSQLDWVIASLHSQAFAPADKEAHTKAYLAVCENRYVDVIGHPTTAKFPFDMEVCVKKFKEYEKLVEINESSLLSGKSTRENAAELLRLCRRYEVPVIIDSDAHYCGLIGKTELACALIEETGFPEKLIINTEWERLREHIIKKHGNIGI